MEKLRRIKMSPADQRFLIHAIHDVTRKGSADIYDLANRILNAPKMKVYLTSDELSITIHAVNDLRTEYISSGKSPEGIDIVLLKLVSSKYRRVPRKYRIST